MKGALVLVLPLFVACSTLEELHGSDASQLEHASQALLDAVSSGDKAVFARALDPEGLFSDEHGNVSTGAAVVQEVRGLSRSYSGNLRMVDPRIRVRGDVGAVASDVAETLELFGQRLNTRFHTTDVYQRTNEGWQLVASQTSVLPNELSRAAVDPTVRPSRCAPRRTFLPPRPRRNAVTLVEST